MIKVSKQIEDIFFAGNKGLVVLVDPDKPMKNEAIKKWDHITSFWLVGGSLLVNGDVYETVSTLKQYSKKPVILFPGPGMPITKADAILFMSLISGRNPELLIGQQVINAPVVRKLGIEPLPTAYLLIGDGTTAAHYMSFTMPLPEKKELVEATVLAGLYLGFKYFYLDGGSGGKPISESIISLVAQVTGRPLFVGGGIRTVDQCLRAWNSGATFVVVGTAVENGLLNPDELWEAMQSMKQ